MLHMLLIYQFRVNFFTLMFGLKQFDPQPRFHVGNFRTCADLESRASLTLDPYQKLFVTWLVVIMQSFMFLSQK